MRNMRDSQEEKQSCLLGNESHNMIMSTNGGEMDIVIYMNEGDFNHKTGQLSRIDNEEGPITAYWSMKRIPKYFNQKDEDDDIIWLACKGMVRGSVKCEEFNPDDLGGETIVWDSKTFLPVVVTILCQPFRGFRYKWWDKK